MKKYIIVLVQREEWDNPDIGYYEAEDEEIAYAKYAHDSQYTVSELEAAKERGEIEIIIRDINDVIESQKDALSYEEDVEFETCGICGGDAGLCDGC